MDDTSRQQEREYYRNRERALQYDRRSGGARSTKRHMAVARKLGEYASEGDLLDIGCGTARMLCALAAELPGLRITGIDVSAEMIEIARQNVTRDGLTHTVGLMVVAAEGLGAFAEGSFDVVQCHGAFSGIREPVAVLAEIRRILKPGGVLYITDWNRAAPKSELRPYLEGLEGRPAEQDRVRMAYKLSYTDKELKGLLGGPGLRMLEFGAEGLWMTAVLRREG